MKRSDMVRAIASEMMSRLPEWEKQERLNFASELLQVCEIEGMLPKPLQVDCVTDTILYTWYSKITPFSDDEMILDYTGSVLWELENEEK